MALQWNHSLETGVAEIDQQHMEFIDRINRSFDACRTGRSAQELRAPLVFLEEYVVVHFGEEERHMKATACPHYHEYKAQHDGLVRALAELKHQAATAGPGPSTQLSASRLLSDWLISHIGKFDRALGRHLCVRAAPPGAANNG
ncbi:MAG: hemerythrin family protein [Deltaproteobacteria bacterium]|nr:hemerythrin family protein [Deltaproteobacteria bacterium]